MNAMDWGKLKADLTRDEGLRLYPYDDATGKPLVPGDTLEGNITVGCGRNLSGRGISLGETDILLNNDMAGVVSDLDRNIPWWRTLPEGAQRGLANMGFNLGWPRLATFKKMLAALDVGKYDTAAAEALDSNWARQVGDRAERIAELFRKGN